MKWKQSSGDLCVGFTMSQSLGVFISPSFAQGQKTTDKNTYLHQKVRWRSLEAAFSHTHLLPPRLSVVQLQEKELPELRNKLQAVNREMEKLKGDVEEQESLLSTLISQEEMAKACLQDVSLMDRYLVESHCRLQLSGRSATAPSLHPNLPLFFLRWT